MFKIPVPLLLIFKVLVLAPPVMAAVLMVKVSPAPTLMASFALTVVTKLKPPEIMLLPVPLSVKVLPLPKAPAPLNVMVLLPPKVAVSPPVMLKLFGRVTPVLAIKVPPLMVKVSVARLPNALLLPRLKVPAVRVVPPV